MARLSGEPPRLWGPSIIGFGRYHYRYESGREGESFRVGFAPRKAALTLYLTNSEPVPGDLLAALGKHKTGQGCLYLKKLADADTALATGNIKKAGSKLGGLCSKIK